MADNDGSRVLADLGGIDIYLLDQMMKGRITHEMDVLDAGCGSGRNISFMLAHGYRVAAVDMSAEAVEAARTHAAAVATNFDPGLFQVATVTDLPFEDASFDVVVCIAVLHFAADEDEFRDMVAELWRVLRPGGLLFTRLASSIGIESAIRRIDGRRHLLPDGTERFLVDQDFLIGVTDAMEGNLLEPIKTVNVQGTRCMTTWVVGKTSSPGRNA